MKRRGRCQSRVLAPDPAVAMRVESAGIAAKHDFALGEQVAVALRPARIRGRMVVLKPQGAVLFRTCVARDGTPAGRRRLTGRQLRRHRRHRRRRRRPSG